MKQFFLLMACVMVSLLAGCGESIHWFPGSSSSGSGTLPSPPPSGQTLTEIQADTVTQFLPYTVRFGTVSSSTTTASITISGDASSNSMYTLNGGSPTNATGTVHSGDVVVVQNTSSNKAANFSMSTTLNIGGAVAYYVSKTGTLIFYSLTYQPQGQTLLSNWATVPATFTNNFVLGSQGTFTFDAGSDSSSQLFLNGNSVTPVAVPAQIKAGDTMMFKHKSALTSNTTVLTQGTLTGSTGTYTLTFKSTTQ